MTRTLTIGHTLHLFIGVTAITGLGCSHTALSGHWTGVEVRNQEFDEQGKLVHDKTMKADPDEDRAFMVIRSDGSFDWGHTMLAIHPSANRLRYEGQRAHYDVKDDGKTRRIEIVVTEAEYTNDTSRFVIQQDDPQDARPSTFTVEAHLLSPNKASFKMEMLRPESRSLRTGILRKLEKPPVSVFEAYRLAGKTAADGELKRYRAVGGYRTPNILLAPDLDVFIKPERFFFLSRPCVYDLQTGKKLRRMEGVGFRIWHMAISPDGRLLAGAIHSKYVKGDEKVRNCIWDVRSGKIIARTGGLDWIQSIEFSPSSKYLLEFGIKDSGGPGIDLPSMQLWNAETGELEKVIQFDSYSADSAAFGDRDNEAVIRLGARTGLGIWDLDSSAWRKVVTEDSPHYDRLPLRTGLFISPDRKLIAGITHDYRVSIVPAEDLDSPRLLEDVGQVDLLDLTWSADNKLIATTDRRGRLRTCVRRSLFADRWGSLGKEADLWQGRLIPRISRMSSGRLPNH